MATSTSNAEKVSILGWKPHIMIINWIDQCSQNKRLSVAIQMPSGTSELSDEFTVLGLNGKQLCIGVPWSSAFMNTKWLKNVRLTGVGVWCIKSYHTNVQGFEAYKKIFNSRKTALLERKRVFTYLASSWTNSVSNYWSGMTLPKRSCSINMKCLLLNLWKRRAKSK